MSRSKFAQGGKFGKARKLILVPQAGGTWYVPAQVGCIDFGNMVGWTTQVITANGRQPTFEEKRHFHDDLEARISKYLREHEEAASNPLTVQAFRNLHQVTAGMEKGQVEVLLGPPFTTSDDAQQMANWARRHWPAIRGRADEAWGYPHGWIFYFDKGKLVDITQYLEGVFLQQ